MAPSNSRQFNKRKLTLKKKAQQLQTLSDVTVCMVCFDADGEVTTWPEDKSQVDEKIINYKLTQAGEGSKEKLKSNLNLLGFLDSKKRKIQKSKKKDFGNLFATWEANLNKLQEKELVALCNCLELKLWGVREKIKVLTKMKEKGKAIQVYNNNGDNSENFVPWGGNCNENIRFVGESSNCDKILNPFDSMVYQTPLHEALPMSIRQSPWPF
ncbi:agamous-like MADS-box protein AGL103 [Mangifera indica]|uniref:agamous-like MADS-box protein AGL103 n=1 Tax=Mangifera indica TaxID=29780 RepID=UPI001CFC1726|nr:agamous-like MADS-box protein AGL103 [Mangifera indica]